MRTYIFVLLPLLFAACATPQKVVEAKYDALGERDIATLFESEHSALVAVTGEDENCSYEDLYVLLNVPPENKWQIRDTRYRKDCDKKNTERIAAEYREWKKTRESNERLWRKGARR